MGKTQDGRRSAWRTGGDTLEAIAAVLTQRWRAAARRNPARQFWQSPVRWLKSDSLPFVAHREPHHLTSGGRDIR